MQPEYQDRVDNPEKYPFVNNDDGSISTHKMSYAESNGKFYAFPMIQMQDDELKSYEDDNWKGAFQSAIDNGNYKRFDIEDEASAYAKGGYKSQALKDWGSKNSKTEK